MVRIPLLIGGQQAVVRTRLPSVHLGTADGAGSRRQGAELHGLGRAAAGGAESHPCIHDQGRRHAPDDGLRSRLHRHRVSHLGSGPIGRVADLPGRHPASACGMEAEHPCGIDSANLWRRCGKRHGQAGGSRCNRRECRAEGLRRRLCEVDGLLPPERGEGHAGHIRLHAACAIPGDEVQPVGRIHRQPSDIDIVDHAGRQTDRGAARLQRGGIRSRRGRSKHLPVARAVPVQRHAGLGRHAARLRVDGGSQTEDRAAQHIAGKPMVLCWLPPIGHG